MMYFDTHPDGSMTRKLKEDWTDEEKTLFERHQAFLKEAEALGYVFRLDVDTQAWVGRFAPRAWKGLTDEELMKMLDYGQYGRVPQYARNFVDAIEAKLKEKNT